METTTECLEMERVSSALFWEYLNRWRLVTSVSRKMMLQNSGGRYAQTGYFSVAEVVGSKMIPDMTNLLGVIRRAPTKSHGRIGLSYFINRNAAPE